MDEKLIDAVKKYPCLWDTKLDTYKCNETRDAAWEIIVKETNFKDSKYTHFYLNTYVGRYFGSR